MATTLQTLIDQTAEYIKVDLADDDDSVIENQIISALNEAKNTVARKYYPLYYTENITLDAYSSFAVTDTTNTFYCVESVTYNGEEVDAEQHASTVYCDAPASVAVSVKYRGIPADMEATTDAYPFPDIVDYRILCYRAAKTYYEIKGTSSSLQKANIWEARYNEAVRGKLTADDNSEIKDVYKNNSSVW